MFERNEKKNRKGTLTPKMPFVEHQLPCAYNLKCLSNLSEEEIESGCRDSAPSITVLKQIRYEQGRYSLLSETKRKVYQKSIRNNSNIAQA